MAAGSSHGFFLLSLTFQTCFVQLSLRVLGLMAYWYTGSAFHQIPQSYLKEFSDQSPGNITAASNQIHTVARC